MKTEPETNLGLYERTYFWCSDRVEALWQRLCGKSVDAPAATVVETSTRPAGDPLSEEERQAFSAVIATRLAQAVAAAKLETTPVLFLTKGEPPLIAEHFGDPRSPGDPKSEALIVRRALRILEEQSSAGDPLGVELVFVHPLPPQGDFPPTMVEVGPCPNCSPDDYVKWAANAFEDRAKWKIECGHPETQAEDHFQLLDSGLWFSPRRLPPGRAAWEAKQARKAGGMRSTKARPPREQ